MNLYNDLLKQLKKNQSKGRFTHSVGVGELAAALAKQHGWNVERARLTGLLHDWAKEWSPKEMKAYVRRYKLKIPSEKFITASSPNHLHAYIGADVARRKKWLTPAESNAVSTHTFGSLRMGKLEKIIYVADLAAPDRKYEKAAEIRELAMKNLDLGFAASMALKMKHQIRKRKPLHPLTIKVWNKLICHA